MANTMDSILVKYGSLDLKGSMVERIIKRAGTKPVPLAEFLAVDPKKLSEKEQKIQKALQQLYDLNGKEPPLFQKFPDFREEKPLVIDTMSEERNESTALAKFSPEDNRVIFDITKDNTYLVGVLAHELKHAEQCDEEGYKLGRTKDSYEWQQLSFLNEAQAFVLSARVICEIMEKNKDAGDETIEKIREIKLYREISEKYKDASGQKDEKKIEEEMISILLKEMYNGHHVYKYDYDRIRPIKETDKGLDHIPEGLHLSQDLMKTLNELPRTALSPNGRLIQALENRNKDEYLRLLKKGVTEDGLGNVDGDYLMKDLNEIIFIKAAFGETINDTEMLFAFSYSTDTKSLKKLLNENKNRKVFNSIIIDAFANRAEDNSDNFNFFISLVQDKKGHLPFTKEDLIISNEAGAYNKLLFKWVNWENLPTLLTLKGRDGEALIDEESFPEIFADCVAKEKNPDKIQAIFDSVKDKNGNLPYTREDFASADYGNKLLDGVRKYFDCEEEKAETLKKLSIMAKWKDKNGLPIITSEDVKAILSYAKELKRLGLYTKEGEEEDALEFANAVKSCVVSGNVAQKNAETNKSKSSVKDTIKNTEKVNQIIKARRSAVKDY